MNRGSIEPPRMSGRSSFIRQILRTAILAATLLLVIAALTTSVALVMYTAWRHDIVRGAFALLFAVLSAQMALNWLLWKDDEE